MGGATQEEVRYNRNAIFHALGEQDRNTPGQGTGRLDRSGEGRLYA